MCRIFSLPTFARIARWVVAKIASHRIAAQYNYYNKTSRIRQLLQYQEQILVAVWYVRVVIGVLIVISV